ncbi:MAG: type 1 glutamine amidotransferase [Phycisphaerales bacterium]
MATLILEHSDMARADRFGTILRDQGHRLEVRRLHAGDALPNDLDGIDAVVSFGGPMEVTAAAEAEHPWMTGELALLRQAHETDRPVVGICLGNQLLARALGGTVERLGDPGIELGWHDVDLTPAGRDDPIFAGAPWSAVQLQAHRWHVSEVPEGAEVLARSELCPVQVWRSGLRTYGIQYHPESHADRLGQWCDAEPGDVADSGQSREKIDADTERHWPAMARINDRLFERIALLVMPLDRRFAGIAKDIHH